MKRRGRRTKLDVKLQREICGYLSDCCTIRTACEATGMSESSFYLWVEKGEEGRSPYKEFSEAITRARGRAKARIVHSLLDEKDWRARLELLARVFPDEYGRREPVPPPPAPPPPPPGFIEIDSTYVLRRARRRSGAIYGTESETGSCWRQNRLPNY
jgi:hypothetical protein